MVPEGKSAWYQYGGLTLVLGPRGGSATLHGPCTRLWSIVEAMGGLHCASMVG
jgi:hypothetical protein